MLPLATEPWFNDSSRTGLSPLLIAILVSWIVLGLLGMWVASQKRRSGVEGFLLGLFFGPFGIIIEALLPSPQPPYVDSRRRPGAPYESDPRNYDPRIEQAQYIARGDGAFIWTLRVLAIALVGGLIWLSTRR